LWDEFFALLHRREMWKGYQEALKASPADAQDPARWLTQWVQRNHVETQAIAIRRISDRSTHRDTIALGRLLDEIAAHPEVLGNELSSHALEDADRLQAASRAVTVFATKVVAHFDRDHAVASQDLRFDDFDRAIDVATNLFERWFVAVTGEGVAILLPSIGWENVLRLHRRDLSIDNPDALGARVVYSLGEPAAQELLETLERSEEERAALIGRLYARDEARWLAELLIEIEKDPDDLVRLNLIAALRRGFGR
jgi:predicted GNAT family N-acyltransferase